MGADGRLGRPSQAVRVAYLGPPGTFSEDALRAAVGDEEVEAIPAASVYDAIVAVREGTADRALVPFENSIEGAVTATLDTLAFDADGLTLVGEYDLPIRHCLIAREEIPLERIEVVLSHPQASAQCARFIRENLPQAEVRGRRRAPPRRCEPSPSPSGPGPRSAPSRRRGSTAPPCCAMASRTRPTTSPASSGSRRQGTSAVRIRAVAHLPGLLGARRGPSRAPWSRRSRCSPTATST